MPTTQLTPVGVGWGNYVIAWLLTYSGADCGLWQLVYRKCRESELCREIIELLQSRGFNIRLHKCYDPSLDIEIVEADQAPRQSNLTSASKPTNTTPNNHTKTMQKLKTPKPSKTKLPKMPMPPRRLCPEPLPETPQTHLSLSHTPHLMVGAPSGQRADRARGGP
jgi:hypothetical protein